MSRTIGHSERKARSAQVFQRLKGMIVSGQLQAGERLIERDLARRLNVSRIPLRESLIRLEGQGLVRTVANTATYVEDFSGRDVVEILTFRLVLEPFAGRLAAFRTGPDLVAELRQICAQMTGLSAKGDWQGLDQIDYEFHRAVVRASQHRRLIRAYDHCQIRIGGWDSDNQSRLKNLPPDHTAREHEQIVSLIEQGDAAGTEKASREHVARNMQVLFGQYGVVVQATAVQPPRVHPA